MHDQRSKARPLVLTPGRARRGVVHELVIRATDLAPFLLVAGLVLLACVAIAATR